VTDYDVADCIAHFGHNVAATQTVAWMRILDRRRGPNPPKLVVVDPRRTDTAKEADVHLAPRAGTNVALMNGLLNLIIADGRIDDDFIRAHTVGFERLKEVIPPSGWSRSRESRPTGCARRRRSSARRGGWSAPCSRVSTRPTRRPPPAR
jgi:ferredoxin-nitrate reductase